MLKGDVAARLEAVAQRGGTVVTTFLSGRVDEDDLAFFMDVPGPLGALMGVRVDEWDARGPEFVNAVRLDAGDSAPAEVPARLFFEIVIPQGAQTVGTYQLDFYAGTPAVTRNAFGGRGLVRRRGSGPGGSTGWSGACWTGTAFSGPTPTADRHADRPWCVGHPAGARRARRPRGVVIPTRVWRP